MRSTKITHNFTSVYNKLSYCRDSALSSPHINYTLLNLDCPGYIKVSVNLKQLAAKADILSEL